MYPYRYGPGVSLNITLASYYMHGSSLPMYRCKYITSSLVLSMHMVLLRKQVNDDDTDQAPD
jgi:hypothetical protein